MKPLLLLLPALLFLPSCDRDESAAAPKAVEVIEEPVVVADPPPVVRLSLAKSARVQSA